ncbi:DUF3667 domain-containing protein [uncultured Winogradskyella sp.]|uniref:DUF3667 domain-containing protein n=1 Tax=uncultured Winogradskyella sp. TaxID=395353 RepID=UPI00260706BD|nr:DUF3667 domain-containing protein [uncultured Winogradskyella sp.]
MDTCQNCEKHYESGFKFCPHCGQKTNDILTLGVLFYNTISNYFSFDARFLKSFIPLMFKPGYLAKEFIKGKRLKYLHPAQMYLFVAVIFFFLFNFYVREGRVELDKNMQRVLASRSESLEQSTSVIPKDTVAINTYLKPISDNGKAIGINDEDLKRLDSMSNIKVPNTTNYVDFGFNETEMDSLIRIGKTNEELYIFMGMEEDAGYVQRKFFKQILKFYKDMGLGQIYQNFIDSIPLAMFFLLPIFAFLLKLFFYKKGRYAHHLVFSFYYFSFLFLVFSIIFGLNRLMSIPDWIDWLVALSTFVYLLLAVIKFYGQRWFLSFIKSGVVSFLFLLLVLPLSFTILGVIAFFFY